MIELGKYTYENLNFGSIIIISPMDGYTIPFIPVRDGIRITSPNGSLQIHVYGKLKLIKAHTTLREMTTVKYILGITKAYLPSQHGPKKTIEVTGIVVMTEDTRIRFIPEKFLDHIRIQEL